MSDHKPITGELRKVMNHTELRNVPLVELGEYEFARRCDEIDAIHAGLERENAELKAEREGDWIKLPVDADGLPIHVGDMMGHRDFPNAKYTVVGIGEDSFFTRDASGGLYKHTASLYPHYHPDTWESIIEDAVNVHGNGFNPLWTDERDSLVARCKKLAGDAE